MAPGFALSRSALVSLALVLSSSAVAVSAAPSPVSARTQPPAEAAVSPDERAALEAAEQRGERVEVLSARTEYSQTFATVACSFSATTLVLMADGTTKPISEIVPGDQVLAHNPETGEQTVETVLAVWAHEDALIELQVTQPGSPVIGAPDAPPRAGMPTITTTVDHPFWNHTDQQWQPAAALDPGDQLHTAGGTQTTVIGVLSYTERNGNAYNLTIDDIHTYYVLAGDTPVLVHNSCIDEMAGLIDAANLNMTETVANHLDDITRVGTPSRPYMNSTLTIQEIMRGSTPVLDPGGVPTALRWDTPGAFHGRPGTWELVIDTSTNTILHFNFVR